MQHPSPFWTANRINQSGNVPVVCDSSSVATARFRRPSVAAMASARGPASPREQGRRQPQIGHVARPAPPARRCRPPPAVFPPLAERRSVAMTSCCGAATAPLRDDSRAAPTSDLPRQAPCFASSAGKRAAHPALRGSRASRRPLERRGRDRPPRCALPARCGSERPSERRLASEICGSPHRSGTAGGAFPAFMRTRYSASAASTTGGRTTGRALQVARSRSRCHAAVETRIHAAGGVKAAVRIAPASAKSSANGSIATRGLPP